MSDSSDLIIQAMGSAIVVRLQVAHVDAENCQDVFEKLTQLAESRLPKLLVLNFRRVRYFHSIAMAALIELRRTLQKSGGRLALCSLDPQVREPLSITRLDRLLEIHDSERVALAT